MSSGKIAVVKNGFDILRIIEMDNDSDNCSFKIVPMIDISLLQIDYSKMFNLRRKLDNNYDNRIEISYHKSNGTHEAIIHIKKDNKRTRDSYDDIPLNRLKDPNINGLFPIPLLEISVPDNMVLTKRYNSHDSKTFDMGNDNVVSLFLTKNDYIYENIFDKFPRLSHLLLFSPFEFFTTGIYRDFDEKILTGGVHNVSIASNISNDIGIYMLKMRSNSINNNKVCFHFIDNEFYLPITICRVTYDRGYREMIYELELDTNDKLSSKEKEKYKYRFVKEIKRLKAYEKSHLREINMIRKYYDKIDSHNNEFIIRSSEEYEKFNTMMKDKSYEQVLDYINSEDNIFK